MTTTTTTTTIQTAPSAADIEAAGKKLREDLTKFFKWMRFFMKNSGPLIAFHFFMAIAYASKDALTDEGQTVDIP